MFCQSKFHSYVHISDVKSSSIRAPKGWWFDGTGSQTMALCAPLAYSLCCTRQQRIL